MPCSVRHGLARREITGQASLPALGSGHVPIAGGGVLWLVTLQAPAITDQGTHENTSERPLA